MEALPPYAQPFSVVHGKPSETKDVCCGSVHQQAPQLLQDLTSLGWL